MKQQLLDDLRPNDEGKIRLRNALIENMELIAMSSAGLCIASDLYNLISYGFYIWVLIGIACNLIVLAYLVTWKKESIAFDSNPSKSTFVMTDNLKVLQVISGLILLWAVYNCSFSLYYFVLEIIDIAVMDNIIWGVILVIEVAFIGSSLFSLYLADKAVKNVNRI